MRFFFNDTATAEIYTLTLHDALPISSERRTRPPAAKPLRYQETCLRNSLQPRSSPMCWQSSSACRRIIAATRSEEHTSELQSRQYLVCRLLLEKKNELLLIFHTPHLS